MVLGRPGLLVALLVGSFDRNHLLVGERKQPLRKACARQVADAGKRTVRRVVLGDRAFGDQSGDPIEVRSGSIVYGV